MEAAAETPPTLPHGHPGLLPPSPLASLAQKGGPGSWRQGLQIPLHLPCGSKDGLETAASRLLSLRCCAPHQ